MNRLLIEAAFPAHFRSRSPHSISVTYLGMDASEPLPFSKQQADSFIKEWVLTTTMSWIVGMFGMIAAILVTSTIIPQMFEPGSITLLLSKPVSRSLLFISKFLGGCAFILLNVALPHRRPVADRGLAVRHLEPGHAVVHSDLPVHVPDLLRRLGAWPG